MAAIDVEMQGRRRETNRELALVPFIDFLLCLVAFLLVTAVWTQSSRLPADAMLPGKPDCCPPPVNPKTLHVTVQDERFVLAWREGTTLLARSEVPRRAVQTGPGDVRFPDLSRALENEWRANGSHRAVSDLVRDGAVLHAPNGLAYAELVGVMDAVRAVKRAASGAPSSRAEAAFAVSLAMD